MILACRTQLAQTAHTRPAANNRATACKVAAPEAPPAAPTPSLSERSIDDVPLKELFDTYSNGYKSIGTQAETDCFIGDVEGTIPPELTGVFTIYSTVYSIVASRCTPPLRHL